MIFESPLGKSQIWKTLHKTYQNLKRRPHAIDRQFHLIDLSEISSLF